jgi:hypothetical protein
MFTAITVAAGLLAGIALRAALAARGGAGQVRAGVALVGLAFVLAATCMIGRALLAAALGVGASLTDWLVLFVAMAAGLGLAELLTRLDRAHQIPVEPAAGLRVPGAPFLVLAAALAIVPAYAATAGGGAVAPCSDFHSGGTTLVAEAHAAFPVRLRWSSAGGCPPIQATIVGVGGPITRQGERYSFEFGAVGGSGDVTDPGPARGGPLLATTCGMTYALRLTDAADHHASAQARGVTCPS